jgi:DNA-binding PadR family transcriptional regulator
MDHHEQDGRHRRGWGRFEAMGRRFGGPGGGWSGPRGSDWGGFGDSLRIGRLLASGDLRLVALYFIEQQPRHGYDLIKAIEERTAGIYVPSPGVIYPALTFLEEAGYVSSTPEGNRRLYTITEDGRAHLDANREAVEATLAHLGRIGEQMGKMREAWDEASRGFRSAAEPPDQDIPGVDPAVNEARRELKQAIRETLRRNDPVAEARLANILRRAAEDIRRTSGDTPDEGGIDI